MIYKKYQRTVWAGLIVFFISLIPLVLFYLVRHVWRGLPHDDIMNTVFVIGGTVEFTALILAFIGFVLARLTKPHDQGNAELDYERLREVVPQFDVWFFKRVMIFNADGAYIGRSTMEITGVRTFFISLLSNFNFLTPLNYHFHDHAGRRLVSFKRRGWRSAVVDIWDGHGKPIGHVTFDELKTLLRFRGYAYVGDPDDETSELEKYRVSSELFFDDTDGSGLIDLSSFRNDVKYHYIFRDFQIRVARLEHPITEDAGKVALAVVVMLYYFRWS